MSQFLTPLTVTDLSKDEQILWLRLERPFRYYSDVLGSESVIPTGFECDGESVPRWLYSVVPPFGAARKGAIAHDALYTFGGYYKPDGTFIKVDRETADLVYHELTLLGGMNKFRSWIRWKTLRAVGWKAWNEHVAQIATLDLTALSEQVKKDILTFGNQAEEKLNIKL